MEELSKLEPSVAIVLIIAVTVIITVTIWQFWKTMREY